MARAKAKATANSKDTIKTAKMKGAAKAAKPKAKPKKVSPIPKGCNTVSAYLVVPSAAEALKFYGTALGAKETMRMTGPDGQSVVHAQMSVGDSMVMLTDENPTWGSRSPATLGGSPVSLHLYVKDADKWFQRAVAAGCAVVLPIEDAFWGDRFGKVKDPFGHEWSFATKKEDLSKKQLLQRQQEFFAAMAQASP